MNRLLFIISSVLVIFCSASLQAEENQYIVKYKSNVTRSAFANRAAFTTLSRKGKVVRRLKDGVVIKLNEEENAEDLLDDNAVDAIEKDVVVSLIHPVEIKEPEMQALDANVPVGIRRIRAEACDEFNVNVAVIDTGIDPIHHDLKVIKGVNFVNPSVTQKDDNGHGTHVAGTIGGKCNGTSIQGVAPGANLIALKVLGGDGSGSLSGIIAAIDWVTDHADEVDVVNMSLGMLGESAFLHDAIKRSVDKGVVYVVAAGNSSMDVFGFTGDYFDGVNYLPAAYPEVMTVSAMIDTDGEAGGLGPNSSFGGKDDTMAYFSNFSTNVHPYNPVDSPGAAIDVAAPGVDILSSYPGNKYMKMSGTSMAAPHVAGAVARFIIEHKSELLGEYGTRDADYVFRIRQIMIDMAEPQENWNEEHDALDPDNNHEGLVQVN